MSQFDQDVAQMKEWMTSERFAETRRLYSPRQVVAQRGTIHADYTIARQAAEGFYKRLRELAATKKSITTYGPYSPGQAVTMKRTGIEGIYLGGWATSAKGSIKEDPGADLASYPLSQVPDEAAPIVRALLAADKNQFFARSRMTEAQRAATPEVNFAPYIIADADTGHGGDAHVRNLVRRFVEAGVPGYHIEDQKPGAKKCGHQGGKVLVPIAEQIKRLNAARLQLDIMKVPGIIVARTDAEAATLLDGRSDERDHPFILGATNVDAPRLKVVSLAVLKRVHDLGITDINGHLLYRVADADYERTYQWMARTGVLPFLEEQVAAFEASGEPTVDAMLERINNRVFDAWQAQAALKTYPEAIADAMEFMRDDGNEFDISVEEWRAFAKSVSFSEARARARALGINIIWNCDHCMTPEGYYQIKSGMEYAIARSIAVAPYCDLIWMETKTANLPDAKEFAEAIHAVWPGKMLAYNLSPSFNWDTTGMSDDEMRAFPKGLGELGYVFNFITYGGHQLDGLAGEEFTANLMQDGMLALARLQRKFRLVDSPYKTPQTLVGGPRLDATLMATSGRTAATKAMGKGSTQFQHLVQTEIPVKLLEGWLQLWTGAHKIERVLRPMLRPYKPGSEVMELSILDGTWSDEIDKGTIGKKLANIVFEPIHDRLGANILSVRDQNNFDTSLRRKRLMTLAHLFLIHRYKSFSLHYVRPSDDNHKQAEAMKALKLYSDVQTEVGQIIVVTVDREQVEQLIAPDQAALKQLLGIEAAS